MFSPNSEMEILRYTVVAWGQSEKKFSRVPKLDYPNIIRMFWCYLDISLALFKINNINVT